MQPLRMPEFSVLHGEDAIVALREYINELEENGDEDLTERQAKVMIKLAKQLISTIKAESHVDEPKRRSQILTQLRRVVTENVHSLIEEPLDSVPEEKVVSHFDVFPSPTPPLPRIK